MNKRFKLLAVLLLFVGLFVITGCKNDDPTKNFKNPKSISYTTTKGTIKLTYDDDGTYEVVKNDPYVTLKNKDENFRVDIDYNNNTIEQIKKTKEAWKKDKRYTIIDNVKYGIYEGFVQIDNTYATAILYLYLDEESDVLSYIKVSPVMSSPAEEEIKNGKKPEDVFYNNEKVQQILKTVQYDKTANK